MEKGDEKSLGLWKKFRDLSIEEYKRIYDRLNVKFDVYSGESLFSDEMLLQIEKLKEKKLLTESKGALVVDLKKEKLGTAVIVKADGATLYITRDIAAAYSRWNEYQFDKMIYVVAAPQDHHFKQLFKVLGKMGYDWVKKCTHVNFGHVNGMSTRKGEVVFLKDILEESKNVMLETMKANEDKFKEIEDPEQVSDTLGLSAVFIQDMSAKRIKDYDFNWSRMTSSTGDTGPYLQYAHARLSSILRKVADSGIKVSGDIDYSLLVEPSAVALVSVISQYPSNISQAAATYEPCIIVQYLLRLSHEISSAYELRVLGQEENLAKARLLLFWSALQILNSGLKLLSIEPLDRM